MELIPHWIAGKRVASTSGQEATVHNPATGKPRAQVGLASVAEVDAAVDAARAAFPAWRATSLSQRAEVLFGLRALIDARRDQIAALLTAEHGKVLSDSLGEIARGLENVEFACGIPQLLKGDFSGVFHLFWRPPHDGGKPGSRHGSGDWWDHQAERIDLRS